MTEPNSLVPTYPDLRGKVALVTGGSRGIGAATCLALARCGVRVAVNGRNRDAVDATVATIRSHGGEAVAAIGDCADLASVERMRAAIEADFDAPELLLAFAGGGSGRPVALADITEQDWRSSIDNNLTSTFFTLKSFLPAMIARGGGSIVTMASAGGRVASGAPAGYGAAKAGVIMLTRHAANELGRHGVRVNCISPSAVLTERTAQRIPFEQQQRMLEAFPLGRLGQPADIASAALFLLSASASWITGVTLDVAGGRVMT